MRRLLGLLIFIFPVLAIVRALNGQTSDKTPAIMAVVIFTIGLAGFVWLFEIPKAIACRYRGLANAHPHPHIRPRGERSISQASPLASVGLTPIEHVRDLLGPVPRQFPSEVQPYLRLRRPAWLWTNFTDKLHQVFRHQERMRREGKVVWAAIVQANRSLFRPGVADSAALIIFSEDPWFDDRPEQLHLVADAVFKLKGTTPPDTTARAVAEVLTVETVTAVRLNVPDRFTEGRAVFCSTIVLPRKHLPRGILSGKFFPIFLDSDPAGPVLPVPAAYWPPFLKTQWM